MIRFILILIGLSACAVERYVDNALIGSSANDGTAWSSAWTNFTSINWDGLATGSNTIYFSGGTTGKVYTERLYVKHTSYADGNRITLRCGQDANHTGTVSFKGGIQMGDESANAAHNVTIDGSLNGVTNWSITKSSAGSTIYHRYGSESGNIYRYLNITTATNDDSQTHCIELTSHVTNTVIEYCEIHNSVRRGIREGVGNSVSGRVTIRFNRFYGNADDDVALDGGVDFYNNISDGTGSIAGLHPDGIQGVKGAWRIYNNVFHDHTQEIFIETTANSLTDVLIYNNVFYDADAVATSPALIFRAKEPVGSHSWSNIVIANNTIVGMGMTAMRFMADAGLTVNVLASKFNNNIFSDNSANILMNDTGEGTFSWLDSEFQWRNNIFYNPQTANYAGTAYASVAALQAGHTNCTGSLSNQPLFVNSGAYNFRPIIGSPSINAGVAMSEFATDADGITRGSVWDIGAYEYTSTTGKVAGTLRVKNLKNL